MRWINTFVHARLTLKLFASTALAIAVVASGLAGAESPPESPSDRPLADSNTDDVATVSDGCFGDDCCWKWISVRAGAVGLHRSGNQEQVLLSDAGTGDTLLSSTDVAPGWGVGPEIDLVAHLSSTVDLEVDWFSLGDWSHQHTTNIGGVVVDPLGQALDSAELRTESRFYNFELNLRHEVSDRLTLLAGFRYIELQDLFALQYQGIGGGNQSEQAAIHTDNHLYGFQLGADGVLWQEGCWKVSGWMKAGIFGNAARSSTDITFAGTPVANIHAHETDLAFVGDLGLRVSRRLGPHLEAYAGYRVMFVDGVALSINQYDSIIGFFNTGTEQVSTNGNPFYHGAEAGLTFTY